MEYSFFHWGHLDASYGICSITDTSINEVNANIYQSPKLKPPQNTKSYLSLPGSQGYSTATIIHHIRI
jgi:hypothetical protein